MRKSNDQSLTEILKEFADQKKFKNKLTAKKLEAIWLELFSSLAGSHTEKIYYAEKILKISISSASLRKELLLSKKLILQQMNSKLGEEKLNDIEFI